MNRILENLKSLVLANRRLIVPNIGAFLTKDAEAGGKKIIFSSFLKYDDGLLCKLLSKKENISEDEANRLVQDFSNIISAAIDNGKTFAVNNFGYFAKDDKGVNIFVVENAIEDKKPAPTIIPIVVEEKIEAEKTIIENEKVEEPVAPEKIEEQAKPAAVVENAVVDTNKIVEEKTIAGPKKTYEKPSIEKQKEEKKETTIVSPASTKTNATEEKRKNRNVGFWILLTILLLILGAVLLYLFNDSFKAKIRSFVCDDNVENVAIAPIVNNTNDDNIVAVDSIAKTDSSLVDIDTTKSTSEKSEQTQTSNTKPSTNETPQTQANTQTNAVADKRYQVIAGCFIYEKYADELVEKLKSQGMNARVSNRLIGELFPVVASESDNVSEAKELRIQCVQLGYDAWIRTTK